MDRRHILNTIDLFVWQDDQEIDILRGKKNVISTEAKDEEIITCSIRSICSFFMNLLLPALLILRMDSKCIALFNLDVVFL